jgi:hypothetical protein
MESQAPCFPEPIESDDRPGLRRETRAEFLRRSTWARAVETRAYYNDSLAALPEPCRLSLCARLGNSAENTLAPEFELLVGRFLQLRGALEVACEPQGERRRVDWRAAFPDAMLHVEAMVPVYNAALGVQHRRHQRLLDVVEARIPRGWWILPVRLPDLDEREPLAAFRREVERLLSKLPPVEAAPEVTRLDGQVHPDNWRSRISILASPASDGGGGLGGGAMVSWVDDSRVRIQRAWLDRRKRSQGRSVPPPALLALLGGFAGADLEDFERALFGTDVRLGREPDGVMALDREPPWAGVLAFPKASPAGADDPVLFLSPYFDGSLPRAIERLEIRRIAAGSVDVTEARDTNVMTGMRWAAMTE